MNTYIIPCRINPIESVRSSSKRPSDAMVANAMVARSADARGSDSTNGSRTRSRPFRHGRSSTHPARTSHASMAAKKSSFRVRASYGTLPWWVRNMPMSSAKVLLVFGWIHRQASGAPLVDPLVRGLLDQNSAIWSEVPNSALGAMKISSLMRHVLAWAVISSKALLRMAFASMKASLVSDSIASRLPVFFFWRQRQDSLSGLKCP